MSAVRVKAPDGSIVEFPAGTDDATIEQVMGREYGQNKPGLLSRAGTAIANAWRGNAAEEAPQALGSMDYLRARSATQDNRSWLDNVSQERRELGAAMFGDDQDLAKVLAAGVDGAKVVNDANGNPMIESPDGKRVYANQPGADPTDALRLAGQIAAYTPAARIG